MIEGQSLALMKRLDFHCPVWYPPANKYRLVFLIQTLYTEQAGLEVVTEPPAHNKADKYLSSISNDPAFSSPIPVLHEFPHNGYNSDYPVPPPPPDMAYGKSQGTFSAFTTDNVGHGDQRRICGLKRKMFFIVLAAVILLLGAAGGGVGGYVASKSSSNEDGSKNSTTTTTLVMAQ